MILVWILDKEKNIYPYTTLRRQLTKSEYGLYIRSYYCITVKCSDFNHCIVVMEEKCLNKRSSNQYQYSCELVSIS